MLDKRIDWSGQLRQPSLNVPVSSMVIKQLRTLFGRTQEESVEQNSRNYTRYLEDSRLFMHKFSPPEWIFTLNIGQANEHTENIGRDWKKDSPFKEGQILWQIHIAAPTIQTNPHSKSPKMLIKEWLFWIQTTTCSLPEDQRPDHVMIISHLSQWLSLRYPGFHVYDISDGMKKQSYVYESIFSKNSVYKSSKLRKMQELLNDPYLSPQERKYLTHSAQEYQAYLAIKKRYSRKDIKLAVISYSALQNMLRE